MSSPNPQPASQEPVSNTTPSNNSPELHRKRRLFTTIAVIIFVVCGLGYLIYWLGWARFEEETDDAYVNGNMIMLTPQINGIVKTIMTDNAQLVDEGQPIIELDQHDYQISLEKARADLAESVRTVIQLFIKVSQLESSVNARKADLLRASLDYGHRKVLIDDGGVSKEDFEHSETTLLAAYATLSETQEMLNGAYAEIEGTTIATHPRVQQAKAVFKNAYLQLHRCLILSPVRGIVTQRRAQVGQYVSAEDPLLSIVPLDQIWVDANFREVQLKNFRIGQHVTMFSDMYGRRVEYHGQLVGLNPGTGSVFSILPPQNATGNWIKIIQRIPVKIAFDDEELRRNPLVLGLSMTVTVDIHNIHGDQLPSQAPIQALYQTTIYDDELEGVDELIEEIIAENTFDDYDDNT